MKYVSIDIETTGRDPTRHQILEFGAIVEDTKLQLPFKECPKFHRIIYHDEIIGEPYALAMNAKLMVEISAENEKKKAAGLTYNGFLITPDKLVLELMLWLSTQQLVSKVTGAGKNFAGFDRLFINNLPGGTTIPLNYRSIEPAMFFIDWENDNVVPDSMTCKERGKVKPQMLHRAIDDAWDMIQLLRTQYKS